VIALGDTRDPVPQILDDSGALVAEHHRERIRRCARDDVPVAVANAAGGQADGDLARAGPRELEVLEDERLVDGPEDGSTHARDSTHLGV
jgi:hypothetical protein